MENSGMDDFDYARLQELKVGAEAALAQAKEGLKETQAINAKLAEAVEDLAEMMRRIGLGEDEATETPRE